MGFFHLRKPAGSSDPVWKAYQDLDRTQWLRPGEIAALQVRQLQALVAHCHQNVPYYQRVLSEVGYPKKPIESLDGLRRIPLLTRDLYQRNFDAMQATKLPSEMSALSSSFTSGTNGVPIQVRKTTRDAIMWDALHLRDLEWAGLDPRGRLASIRFLGMTPTKYQAAMRGAVLPYWSKNLSSIVEMGPAFGMEIRQDPRRQLEWLSQVKPDYLLSMPSNLELLAGLLTDSGQRHPSLRSIQAVGEMLTDDAKQRIEAGFGVPVKNLYSTTESGYIASTCPTGSGLHVHSENVIVEVLDASGNPCKSGETGRLVFTSLHNFITPFIRYDILDDVTLAPGPCPCGRGLPLWTRVDGRQYPTLQLLDGRGKSSIGIVRGIRIVGGVHQFQVIQDAPDHVLIRFVPDRTWQEDNATRMRQVIHDEFEWSIRVDVDKQQFLERPAGGKLKLIVIQPDAATQT